MARVQTSHPAEAPHSLCAQAGLEIEENNDERDWSFPARSNCRGTKQRSHAHEHSR
jgi:hypothetical protein